jgi:hypothetical protein
MESLTNRNSKSLQLQGMEYPGSRWLGIWPFAMIIGLAGVIVFGHGCHSGGHDDDDELVYRPAALAPANGAGRGD